MASGSRGGRGKSPMAPMGSSNYPQSHNPQDYAYYGFDDDEIEIDNIPNVEEPVPTQGSMNPPTEEASITMEREGSSVSSIWEHFTKAHIEENKYQLTCKHCGKNYKFVSGQGYGTYQWHLRSKHPTLAGIDTRQQQISGYAKTNAPPLFRYSENVYKEELARFTAVEHLAFNFGEKFGFNNFIQNACTPQAKPVSRNTLKRQIFNLYKKGKEELKIFFMNYNGRVHIGSDIWTDPWQIHSYMGITCHWIDDDWNIQKRIIAFRVFEDRHTAINIYRLIRQVLEEYCLVEKVFSIGFDNAAANTASIEDLEKLCKPTFGGEFFHVRCACHVLNLSVQEGLQTLNVFLDPIKIAIQYLWRHPQIIKDWCRFCKQNGKRPRRFSRDVPTRWNSTYELLNQSFEYKDLLYAFISTNVPQLELLPQHWNICQRILDCLKVFNDATYTLSGVYYPTTHLFIIECVNIAGVFEEYEDDEQLGATIKAMKSKWLTYYKHIPFIYLVASVFDPRTKLEGVKDFLTMYYGCLHIEIDLDINLLKGMVSNSIVALYNDYYNRYNATDIGSSSQFSRVENESEGKMSRGYKMLMSRQKRQRGHTDISEFDHYLSTNFETNSFASGTDFQILEWWKEHSSQYRILSIIARQVLATPCSTVAVEQAFSAGGNILDDHRSRLSPQSVEAQACVDDWTKAQYRQQEMDRNVEGQFFDDGASTITGTTVGSDD